ncbi:MAG: hypothetical protein ABSG85_11610, partial [Spirochaetia bacterium]
MLLRQDAAKAESVLVTTDPLRDTPKVIAECSQAIGMFDSWHFVRGALPTVRKVWKDYYIGVEIDKEASRPVTKKVPDVSQIKQKG